MSFLPYGSGGATGWITAMGSSAVVHGGLLLVIMGGYLNIAQLPPESEAEARPDFTITLERLDADTLAGMILQDGVAGADGTEPSESLEPVPGEDTPESLAAESADGVTPEPVDTVAAETPPELPDDTEAATAAEAEATEAAKAETAEAAEAETTEAAKADAARAADVQEAQAAEADAAEAAAAQEALEAEAEAARAAEAEPTQAAEADTAEAAKAETTEAAKAETTEAAKADVAQAAQADTLDTAGSESLAALTEAQMDAAQPLSPDILGDNAAEALQPLVGDVLAAAAPQASAPPVDASPLISETATAVRPRAVGGGADALNPVRLDAAPQVAAPRAAASRTALPQTAASQAALPQAGAPQAALRRSDSRQTATPVAADRQSVTALAALRPEGPAPGTGGAQRSRPPQPRSQQDLAIGDLIQRIRGALAESCLVALPRRDGTDGVGLALTAAQEQAMSRFADNVLIAQDADIRQTRTLIDPRQCPALTYMRQNRDYPITRLGLSLDRAEVPSGGRLTGTLRGTAGRYVTLLLVDNNGVVQDLQRFLSFSGNFARFDVPVTRAGAPRDTSQILLALSTAGPTTTVRDRAGQLAGNVFDGLEGELGGGAAIAFTTFDVR